MIRTWRNTLTLSALLLGTLCCGLPPASGGDPDAGATGPGDGSRMFMEECTQPADCQSMLCVTYRAKGKNLCTLSCSDGSACPSPSTGCNGMGYCKAP